MPLAGLGERMMCPSCGNRRVNVIFGAAGDGGQGGVGTVGTRATARVARRRVPSHEAEHPCKLIVDKGSWHLAEQTANHHVGPGRRDWPAHSLNR